MKTNTLKNLVYTILLSVFSIGISVNGYAQCGTESITVSPWCEGGFAKWAFNTPTTNAQYSWYNYAPGPYTYDANGTLITTGGTNIGILDSTTASSYFSPFRVTTAGVFPATTIEYTYQKKVPYTNINPYPATTPTFSTGTPGSTFSMDFTTTLTNAVGIRISSVKVPVVLNTPGQQYKIQVNFGTPGGPGSAIYTFSTLAATNIGGNNYIVEIPVNYTITSGVNQKMFITNPTGGTGVAVDGLLYSSVQAPAFSAAGNPVVIPAASAAAGPSTSYSQIYDWKYSIVCTPQQSGASSKTTVGCCVPPTSVNTLTLSSNKASINPSTETAILSVGNASPSAATNWFDWYLDGVNVPAASGVNKLSYTTNLVGNWEVHELTGLNPSATDKANQSCYSSSAVRVDTKKIFATIVTAPSHSPLCIGDTWTLSGSGSSNLTWSTGGGSLSNTTGSTTTFTANQIGTTQVILSGDVIPGVPLITNGDFSSGNVGINATGYGDPKGVNGTYNVGASADAWGAQPDWNRSGQSPYVTGNPGNFLVVNGTADGSLKKLIWGQNVTPIQPNKAYTFSFDLTSISYVISDNSEDYNATPAAPWRDVVLQVFINGVSVGTASTNFAANGGRAAVGKWITNQFTWNSGTAAAATIEIRQISPTPNQGRGYDYGLDNILFGGIVTQTDAVTIGPITDCSAITASASACINDTYSDLTAIASGGLIFDHWELLSNPNVSVSTSNPYRVQTLTATDYVAVGYLGIGNVLSNGDFNSGDIGFISGNPYYTVAGAGHGDNKYSVDVDIATHNPGWWTNIPQAPGQPAGSMRYFADAKAARPGQPSGQVLAWTFTANQNDKFAFSGYFANIHNLVLSPTDTVNGVKPAAIGIYINNVLISSYWSLNDRDWHQLLGTWTAPLAGNNSYTLEVRDLKRWDGGGNDFALDDFRLVPLTGTPKKVTVTTPVCNPCLLDIPTQTVKTFCGNVGTVQLTPAATDQFPTSVEWTWYDAATAGNILGTSVGSGTATLNVSAVPTVAGNKTVYYTRTKKGSGMVGAKPACTFTYDNANKYSQRIVVYKDMSITELKFMTWADQGGGFPITGQTFTLQTSPNNPAGASGQGSPNGTWTNVPSASVTVSYPNNTPFEVTLSLSTPLLLTGSATGTVYHIRIDGPKKIGAILNCGGLPVTDDVAGQQIVDMTRSYDYGNNPTTNNFGSSYDIKFSLPAYPCPRVPVVLTPSCPCTPPTSVTITPATQTLCAGANLTIVGAVTLSATPPTGAYQYTWYKGTYSVANIVAGPSATYADFTKTGVAVADAGTYTLRVEDYTAPGANASCYKEASVTITVDAAVTTPSISTAQTICTGTAPSQIGGAVAGGGSTTATATYLWESSANGTTGWTTVAGATLKDYTPGTLSADIYYRRTDTKGVCTPAVSNVIKITVDPVVTTPSISTAQTICSGTAPSQIGGAVAAGGSTTATATYLWESSANGTTGWTTVAGATLKDYTPGTLSADIYYRRTDKKGACAGVVSNVIKITVDAAVTTPSISTAQTICTGTAPSQIGGAVAAGGSTTATATYLWESSANGTTGWTTVAGATLKDYTPGTLSADIYYRRTDTKGVCTPAVSNVIKITVDPVVTTPSISTDQTICAGTAPSQIGGAVAGGGSTTATATYLWESSANGTTGWTTVAGATLKDYTPGTLSADIYYRRTDKKGACAGVVSNVIKITVDPVVTTPSISTAQTICAGTAPSQIGGAVAAGGSTTATATYLWESSANGTTGWTTVAGATLKDYTPGTLSADIYYRRTDKKGACAGVVSNVVKITVDAAVTTPSISTAQTICTGTAPSQIGGAVAGGGSTTATATYLWESSANGTTGWTTVAGATLKDYTPGTLSTDIFYRRTDTKGVCTPAISNVIKITVDPLVTQATITADQAICSASTPSLIGGPVAAGGSSTATATYVWENSVSPFTTWNVIGGANTKDYQPPSLTAETWYRRTDKKGTCAGVVSTVVKITITAVAPATVNLSRTPTGTICEGTNVTFTASVGNGGTPTYVWTSSVNGTLASTTNTYSSTGLVNGEVITVDITSSLACANPNTASASTTMAVTTKVTPTVTLTADKTTICPGDNVIYTATSTNGGTPTYTWSGTPTAAGTGATYSTTAVASPNSVTVTVNSSLTCVTTATATSTPVVVTVTPVPTLTVTAVSDRATICSGQTVIFTATPGGTGATPAPTYEWFIGTSTTAASTSNPFSTTSLTTTAALSPQTYSIYVRATSTAACASTTPVQSLPVTVTVNAGVGAGTITTATPAICYDAVPGVITEASAAVGVGAATYTWEESTDPLLPPSSWGPAQGTVTGTGFTPSGQKTGDIYYRRTVTFAGVPAPCNTSQSNTVHVIVRPQLVAGVIGTSLGTCSGASTATMSETTAPTGGDGTFTYQWQSSTTGLTGSFTDITPGGTGATYNAGNLTSTMYYQRVEISGGGCGSIISNIVTKTITAPEVVTVSINNPGQICASSGAFNFVATASTTGTGTLSYAWTLTDPVTLISTSVGTDSPNYSYTPVVGDDNKTVKVVVTTSTGCNAGPGTSNVVTLDIVNAITPTVTITGEDTNCAGLMNIFSVSSTGGGTAPGPTYQWYVVASGSPVGATGTAVGTGGITYSNSTLANGDRVRVEMTSSSNCLASGLTNPFKSTEITMIIKPIPAPSIIEGDQTICSPNTFTFHGNVTPGNTYEWRNGTTVVGTNADFTAIQGGTYTLHEDNGTCNSTSQPVVLTIVQTPIANAGTDMYLKEGDAGSLNGSGGSVYSWSPATYLSSATVSNPNFTATQTITYQLTVSNTSGTTTCSTTDDVTVFVVKPIIVPNVITVNGDGSNDDWYLENIEGYPNAIIEIYNRWGNLVWKSEGYPKNWDGTNFRNGQVLPDGTYFYIINLKSEVYPEPLTGWIQIVK